MNRRTFLQTVPANALLTSGASRLLANGASDSPGHQRADPRPTRFGDGRDWFFQKRFGLFVHWGLYAIPGWHEQHQLRLGVARDEYAKLNERWNPVHFNPDKWLDLMQMAGMQYLTVTAKHCDGFCLWDTKQTAFNTMNTPYGKDIIRQLADACHRRNIPLCLYYSIVDWNHPNYPHQSRAHERQPQPQDKPDEGKYVEFVREQVRELCTNYGDIHGFWWDAMRLNVTDPTINDMIRRLQPKAVINNRGFDKGDFNTPERDYDKDDSRSFDRLTEACQSIGMESWGYRTNEDYYTSKYLMRSIDKYLARDANYLLNVGPDPTGLIPDECVRRLGEIGSWYGRVQESLVDVEPASSLTSNTQVLLTRRQNTLYVHLNAEPLGNVVKLRPFTTAPKRVTLLNNGRSIATELVLTPQDHISKKAYLRFIDLPVDEFVNEVMVLKVDFDRPPETLVTTTNSSTTVTEQQK